MKTLLGVSFATIYGLTIRLLFGFFNNIMSIMSVTALIIVPVIIGFATVMFIPLDKISTGVGAFFKPWLTTLAILFLTILINLEGAICWIMIYPLFSIMAGFGGLGAYYLKKKQQQMPDDPTIIDWEKPDSLKISLVLLTPLFFGWIEGDRSLAPKELSITEEVIIAAPPAEIWYALTHVNKVDGNEKKTHLANALGFPHHLQTTLDSAAVGGKRMAYYEHGLYFEETITAYEPERLMVLDIDVDPDKIPPTVMDEHILIGGKHVDVLEDTYRLTPLSDGTSQLSLTSRFYINTPFNWYSRIWAKYLMSDLLSGELDLIRHRAQFK